MTSPVSLIDLPDYLRQQRWFGGKAWPIKGADVLDYVVVPSPPGAPFVLAVVEVVYELGNPERYALVVSEPGARIEEALTHDTTVQALYRLVRDGGRLASASGFLVGEPIPGAALDLGDTPAVRRLGVEQSNTSVVLGEQVIMKLIRKLEPGANPEAELGLMLSTRTRFRALPELLGLLHLESQGTMTVAVLHRFVPQAQDGWKYVTALLEASPAGTPELFEHLTDLGRVIGELHVALASIDDAPGFAPEPIQTDDLQRWSSNVMGEMGVTLSQAQHVDPDIFRYREPLVEQVKELAHAAPSGQRIRVHGDLHLGQVLRANDGWLVFDFEGEPGRTFSQRREKTSALKDVAGMLRSLDYAAASVGQDPATRRVVLTQARRAFLAGYRGASQGTDFLPKDPESFSVMLRVFELEKLLYELRYELANRPDWVRIPLEALKHEEGELGGEEG